MSSRFIRLAFRFDDPSPVSKRAVEEKVLFELQKRRVPATFAVVPFRHTSDAKISFTRNQAAHFMGGIDDGTVEIAQHGFTHRDAGYSNDGARSEFFGVPPDEQ